MSKHKYKTNESVINITIPIETDEYLRKFILDNAFMRNHIRNDFVEEANKYKGDWNNYNGFKVYNFKTYYFNTIEKPIKRYEYYCVGLSEQVADDIITSIKVIKTKNKKKIDNAIKNHMSINKITLTEFHYKRFDFNRYSFKVKSSHGKLNDKFYTRLNIVDDKNLIFRVRSNKFSNKEYLNIKLKESLYNEFNNSTYIRYYTSNGYVNECTFTLEDVKEIIFKYDCGHYYIQLSINVNYLINKNSIKYSKNRLCGIDTGIRHPITIYDGTNTMYIKMDDKTSRKIHYLERRIRRLQKVYQRKYDYNKEHNLSI